MLGDRNVDYLVDIQKRVEYRPGSEDLALQVDFLKPRRVWKYDLCASALSCSCDSRTLKTAARIIAASIGDNNSLSTCIRTLSNNLSHDVRIRIRSLLGSAIPPD